jgi:hypothetical protein
VREREKRKLEGREKEGGGSWRSDEGGRKMGEGKERAGAYRKGRGREGRRRRRGKGKAIEVRLRRGN